MKNVMILVSGMLILVSGVGVLYDIPTLQAEFCQLMMQKVACAMHTILRCPDHRYVLNNLDAQVHLVRHMFS